MYNCSYKKKDENYLKELVLSQIPNEPCGVNSKDISSNINLCSRDVRLIIQKLRDDGHPICATPHDGYWVSRTSWDMDDTIRKMQSHINECSATLVALKTAQRKLKEREGIV